MEGGVLEVEAAGGDYTLMPVHSGTALGGNVSERPTNGPGKSKRVRSPSSRASVVAWSNARPRKLFSARTIDSHFQVFTWASMAASSRRIRSAGSRISLSSSSKAFCCAGLSKIWRLR